MMTMRKQNERPKRVPAASWWPAALAILAVGASPGRGAAATLTYAFQSANPPVTVSGYANWGSTCGNKTAATAARMSSSAGVACTSNTVAVSLPTNATDQSLLLLVAPTAYAADTTITGGASAFTIQSSGFFGQYATLTVQLGYLAAGGAFTSLGQVSTTPTSTAVARWDPSLSTISGIVPAGNYLAVRVAATSNSGFSTLTATAYVGANANSSGFPSGTFTVTESPVAAATTLADGTNPGSVTVGPDGALTDLDAFVFQTNTGTDTVTGVTVTLAPANAYQNVGAVAITSDDGLTTYGTVANPTSNTVTFSGLSIPVGTTATQFRVKVQPRSAAAMPAPPGASYATTGTVTAFTGSNPQQGSDPSSATVTIDNASPANGTGVSGTAGDASVAFTWTNPADADYAQMVLLRWTGSAGTDVPAEGVTTYAAGNTVGGATVACVTTSSTQSTCTDSNATNGIAYHYELFWRDGYGNYSTGVAAGPFTPTAPNARIVYSTGSTTPQVRGYWTAANTFDAAAGTAAGATPAFMVDRAAPFRNEHLAGYVSGTTLYVIRWDGSTWTSEWTATVGGDAVNGRRFDIAYENSSGDALVVYSTTTNGQLAYRTWSGSAWSGATNFTITIGNQAAWVKLLPQPGSDQIALTVQDTGTTTANTSDLTTAVWSGTAWGTSTRHATNMPNSTAATAQNDLFDMAWETNSGVLWVFWTQATPEQYRRSRTAAGTWNTASNFGTGYSAPMQMVAASDPRSDAVLVAFNRSGSSNVYAAVGSTASGGFTASTVGNNGQQPSANELDLGAQWLVVGTTSYPLVVWGTLTFGTLGYNSATVSGVTPTWRGATTVAMSGASNWGWIDTATDPFNPGTLMLTYGDGANDLFAKRLGYDGTTFTWTNANGGGAVNTGTALTTTLSNNTTQNFSFAYDRFRGTLTLGNNSGTEAPSQIICPNAGAAYIDHFTMQASSATTVQSLTTAFNADPTGSISLLEVTNDAGTPLGSVSSPAGTSPAITGLSFAAPTTTTQYRLRITPNPAMTAAAPAFTATVSSVGTNPVFAMAGADTASATITIDNTASPDVTGVSTAAGSGQVSASWTNPAVGSAPATDFGSYVVVLGNTAPVADRPAEGTASYTAGATVGTSTVVCAGNVVSCPWTGLVASNKYYMKIFTRDGCSNWSAGVQVSAQPLPATPAAPTFTNVATTSVTVSWSAVTGATSYDLQRATNSAFTANLTTLTGVTSPYADTGSLAGNTTNWYRVVARNGSGSTTGASASVLTLPAVPGTPTYSSVTASSLTVSWTAPTGGATSYSVQRSLDNVTFTNVVTGLATTSYGDSGLSAGTTYYYRVLAVNASGATTGASSSITTLTMPPPGTPGTPTYSSITGTSVTVSWTAASGTVASYTLQRATDSGFTQNVATFTGATSPYADSGLAGSTTYWYRVVAVNAGGSTTGAASSVTTLAGPPGAPGTPTYSSIAQTTLTVSWTAALGTVTSYTVQRSTDGTNFTNAVTGVTGLTWNATGLTANTQYWFRIVAVNGNGSTTGTASTVTTLPTAPGTPGTPTYSSIGSTTLSVSWSAAAGATSYDLQRDTSSAFTSATTLTNVTSPYADSGLSPSTTYWYRVVARNAGGSTTGGSSSVTTIANPSLAVTLGSTVPAGNVAAGSSGTVIGRIALTPANGTVTLSALSVSNVLSGGGSGTAVAGADVASLDLFDVTGATTVFVGSAAWNSTTSHYDFTNLAYVISAAKTLALSLEVGPGATAGRTFAMSVTVPADVTVASPSTVSNTTTLQGNTFTITAGTKGGSTAANAPMVSIVNPASATVVSPNPGFKVQIRVFNMVGNKGVDGVSSVKLSADNGATFPYTATGTTAYDAIFEDPAWTTTVTGRTYEVVVSNLAQGSYTLRAQAVNTAPQTVTSEPVQVVVAAARKGDGNLLVRDNSAQLCTDCHAVQTHSSEAVGTTYGAWATTCRDCHTPHRTRNVALVRESITPPSVNAIQSAKNVGFVKFTGDSSRAGWDTTNGRPTVDASFVNTTDRSGPCQVCHTRTVNPANGLARWRNTGNADPHWVSPKAAACTGCHSHKNGFAPGESTGGSACASCHQPIWNAMTGATAGLASKHQLGTVTGTNDSPTDSGVDWSAQTALGNVAPAQRSCVNMCHGDHPHDIQTDTTHSYDLYLDPLTVTSRGNTATRTTANRAKTDFDPATNTGMCARCHSKPVTAGGIAVSAAAFGASAHDFTSNTVGATTYTWQYNLHKGTTARNCTKCHASRTEGTTPTSGANGSSASAVHGTTDDSLLAGTKTPAGTAANFVCYNCHGSAAAIDGSQGNRSGKNVQAQIADTYNHPTNSDSVHDSTSEYAGGNPTTRHVSCMDCHDTHQATATNPLQGAPGVKPTNSTTPGGTPTAYTFERISDPSHQYKTCFRCHSNWSASGLGTGTNVAIEFNPNNESLHRVEADQGTVPVNTTGTAYGIWKNATFNSGKPTGQTLTYAQIMMPSRASYTDASLCAMPLRCSDCHGDNAADGGVNVPEGPHGSTNQHILKVPAGSPYNTWNSTVTYSLNGGTIWCFNCHSPNFTGTGYSESGGGNLHTNRHNDRACQLCHLANPHGQTGSGTAGQRKHLLSPASFTDGIDGTTSGSHSQGEHTYINSTGPANGCT